MDSAKLIKVLTTETRNIINHHLDYQDSERNHVEECRVIITKILDLASEDEQIDILYNLVKCKHPAVFNKIHEM